MAGTPARLRQRLVSCSTAGRPRWTSAAGRPVRVRHRHTWQVTSLAGSVAPGGTTSSSLRPVAPSGPRCRPPTQARRTSPSRVEGGGRARRGRPHLRRDRRKLLLGRLLAALVGYGAATDYEGARRSAIDNTTARRVAPALRRRRRERERLHGRGLRREHRERGREWHDAAPPSSVSQGATLTWTSSGVVDRPRRPAVASNAATEHTATGLERLTVTSNGAAGTRDRSPIGVRPGGPAPSASPAPLERGVIVGRRRRCDRCDPDRSCRRPPRRLDHRTERRLGTSRTRLGFVAPLPVVPAGRYTATLTFTVIGR